MKQKSYRESQIIGILKEAESELPIPALCRKHVVGNATFYKWRIKYDRMDASLLQRMKELE